MPNWAYNNITCEGPEVDIQTLIDRQIGINQEGETALDFETLIPIPANITEDKERDWLLDNWGVASDAIDFREAGRAEGFYAIRFSTAWKCPLPIFHALASKYPNLRSYILGSEEAMDWAYIGYSADGRHEGITITFPPNWKLLVPLLESLEFEAYKDLVVRLRASHCTHPSTTAQNKVTVTLILDALRSDLLSACSD
jgi:hypothetical protein